MEKILLINADEPEEVRVAVVEDGRLEEVYIEAGTDPTGKGNVYVGRVQNVERGIGAAFVDLGGGVTGFLHVSDIADPPSEVEHADASVVTAPARRRREEIATAAQAAAVAPGGETAAAAAATPASADVLGPEAEAEAPAPLDDPAFGEAGPEVVEAGAGAGLDAEACAPAEDAPSDACPPGDGEQGDAVEAAGDGSEGPDAPSRGRGLRRAPRRPRSITDLVKPGDLLLVQVSRGPVGQKGPTLTTRISLPGRYLVLLANSSRSGVSRRISSGEERSRMRALLGGLEIPQGMAVILRTASNGRTREEVQADLVNLYRLWENLKARLLEGGGPRLVHEESDLVSRAIRDILPPDCFRIVTDDPAAAERMREYLQRTSPPSPPAPPPPPAPPAPPEPAERPEQALDAMPAAADPAAAPTVFGAARPIPGVEVHPGPTPLFHAHGIEAQIEDAFRRTLRLPSGGSLVVDPTEALVAIDVNSGRLTEEEDLETTALKTDLEAVPEVARQLRLRDLGGVVVIDFIDLRSHEHVRQVEQALREALKRDRARIRMGRMGPFGCLELTRQRIRPALLSVTHVECPTCGGAGRRRHPTGLALRVLRELRARAARSRGHGGMEVRLPPPIADLLRKRKGDSLEALEAWLTGPFRLVPDSSLAYGGWSIRGLPPRPQSGRPAPQKAGGSPPPGPETA